MQGILRYNTERTAFEAQVDSQKFDPIGWPETQLQLLIDGPEPFLAVLEGFEGLKSHTIYQLVPVSTMVKMDLVVDPEDLDDETDEEDEDEDDDPGDVDVDVEDDEEDEDE